MIKEIIANFQMQTTEKVTSNITWILKNIITFEKSLKKPFKVL